MDNLAWQNTGRSGWRWIAIFLTTFGLVQALIVAMLSGGGDSLWESTMYPIAALGALLGPLAGGVGRMQNSCCVEFSVSLLPWFLPALAVAGVGLGLRQWKPGLRLALWSVGLFAWMMGAPLSLLHAMG